MTPRARGAVALVALVAVTATTLAAQDQSAAPVSIDRVRARLEKPPALTLQTRTPDFTVHIEKRRPMQDIFDVPAWATDPVGWQPPGIGFDVLSVFRYLATAKREHDERRARDDVQRTIADYCAAQAPDDRRASVAQICPSSPAIR